MGSDNTRGVIELGDTYIKCLIFRINDDNSSEILSTSVIQSEGFHNGVVVNLTKASKAIRSCVSAAEKQAKAFIKKINVVLEQTEFLCTKFSKHRKINGAKIHKNDVEFLLKEAKRHVTHNDYTQSIIHIFNHNYVVDGKIFIEEPIDIYADYLSHEITFITMPKNNVKNINQAFIDCDIEVERFISCTFALAIKLLNDNELRLGSALIDVGFEKTSLGLFRNLALVHSMTFPIGINHITKDISKVCSLSLEESENIRNAIDLLFENGNDLFDEKDNLKEIYFKTSGYRKISKALILNIIKARLEEIFEMIKKQMIITGSNSIIETNLFLVGDGSNLSNLEKYSSNFFGSNVKKLSKNYKKESERKKDEEFAACLGALHVIKDGWETEAIPESIDKNNQKVGFFAKIFGIKL